MERKPANLQQNDRHIWLTKPVVLLPIKKAVTIYSAKNIIASNEHIRTKFEKNSKKAFLSLFIGSFAISQHHHTLVPLSNVAAALEI
ncbi:hypothetical protein [Bartonella queenslandensis]|uniref:hypothetical protein n=1 Tax=Bartonella queenslandensis TaxID=481138 RepID=UPI00030B49BF|nr:hypothetical protein [Bartonella queenslandensis]